jgi:hypothetical protein
MVAGLAVRLRAGGLTEALGDGETVEGATEGEVSVATAAGRTVPLVTGLVTKKYPKPAIARTDPVASPAQVGFGTLLSHRNFKLSDYSLGVVCSIIIYYKANSACA